MTKTRDIRRNVTTAVLALVFLAGVCLVAYPTVSDWWNQQHASRAVASYAQAVEDASAEDLAALLKAARAYNADLAENPTGFSLSDAQTDAYERQLTLEGATAMATLEIPSINVSLPVYHGTSDGVLQTGIGHLAGSSLPVGGASTHAVLMGHRGLPSAKLLTNLDRLEVGDSFSITCLGETLYYEVDQVLIVEPTDLSALAIQEGEDLCTLVTCTPYGVNTHRLLVRGHRVDAPDAGVYVTADAHRLEPMLVACVVAVPLLAVLIAIVLVRGRMRASRQRRTGV